jgi:aspartate/glutamate racemase
MSWESTVTYYTELGRGARALRRPALRRLPDDELCLGQVSAGSGDACLRIAAFLADRGAWSCNGPWHIG